MHATVRKSMVWSAFAAAVLIASSATAGRDATVNTKAGDSEFCHLGDGGCKTGPGTCFEGCDRGAFQY